MDVDVAGARRRRRRRWFAVGAAGVGLVLAAALVEVGFRLFWKLPPPLAMFDLAGLYVADADGGTSLRPGFDGVVEPVGRLPTRVTANALGMRDREFAAKAAGERRLLVLGDSMVFGYGVQVEHALPAALQRELTARGETLVVGNGGIPGFGVRDMASRLRALDTAFGADAFVLCACLGNDAVEDMWNRAVVYGGLRFVGPQAQLVKQSLRFRLAVRSRAWLWFETWLFTQRPAWSPMLTTPPDAEEIAWMNGLPGHYPEFAGAYAGVFLDVASEATTWVPGAAPPLPKILGRLREALVAAKATAAGRPFVFVLLPTRWQTDEDQRQEVLRAQQFAVADYPRGKAQQRWLGVAAELGIPAIDLTPAIVAAGPADLWVDQGGHFNGRGAALVAGPIADAVQQAMRR